MKNKNKKSLVVSSIIAIFIAISPYLLYIPNGIQDDVESLDTFLGTIKGGHYGTVQVFIYFLLSKLVPLILFFIWFITCKDWWVHALIIPISVYIVQLTSVFNDSVQYVDEVEFIYSIPIATIVMLALYFIRSKLAIYIQAVDLKKEMDENMKIPKKFG